jgi:hypothetical protein
MPEGRERDRYARASLREQAGDLAASARRHPGIVAIIAIVVGGWLVLNLATPTPVKVRDLQAGDCLYIRAADADRDSPTGRPAGSSTSAVAALYSDGAEKASCDGSHSHEVLLQTTLADGAGTEYPGRDVLVERTRAACEAAFAEYVGRPPEGSALELIVAVPPDASWTDGVRAAPCLVGDPTGQFLLRPANGSGL